MQLGHYDQAVSWLEESIELTSELGDRWGLGTAFRQYGAVELAPNLTSRILEFAVGYVLFSFFTEAVLGGWHGRLSHRH